MFKEEVNITNNKLTIKVTAEKIRKFSFEEKKVYRKDITCLIPQELRNKIKLLSEPKKLISNYKDSNFFPYFRYLLRRKIKVYSQCLFFLVGYKLIWVIARTDKLQLLSKNLLKVSLMWQVLCHVKNPDHFIVLKAM